jgi:glycerol-3-phosphate acyltransferase PlsX
VFLDSGANVDCSAEELVQFAWLGAVYAETVLDRKDPVVGLLSIGEEEAKGNAVSKEAHTLFRNAGFNFQGNVEGRDLPPAASDRGPIDVVVCDGFVGNVVLKFYESVMFLVRHLAEEGAPDMWERKEIRAAFRMLDYSQYGGAPLLGVKGVSIICHGSSNANAIHHAIRVAVQSVETELARHIGAEFAEREAATRT